MLEVVNLTKIYQGKGGVTTRALDGVSLSFPKRGMVFLLGKSGSGKSTLLNLCGGLDSPTEGEIVVKGKSSKTFSPSDFDSYRNTYIGFIFQEYNLLEEFSVADNIALALELQGKSKEESAVEDILRQVEMEGFADRKPNTLSGGQKQRVAIARALVKNPEIIMADEPSGALDSETGAQVFDTLKKLSADKLVLVVSHDREFAETYADRIVELKDGKVLSDLTKSTNGDFTPTEALSKPQDTPPAFILSRLPAKRAVRMGVSSLKTKPVRLAFTLLLCFLSFAIFGLFSTLTLYDREATMRKSLQDSDLSHVVLQREIEITKHEYNANAEVWDTRKDTQSFRISQAELDSYKALYGEGVFGVSDTNCTPDNLGGDPQNLYPLEAAQILNVAVLPKDTSSIPLLAGRYSQSDDEILVSEYFARGVMSRGFTDGQQTPKTIAELVGKKLKLDAEEREYVVAGVFASDYERLVEKYPALVSGSSSTQKEYQTQQTWVREDLRETMSLVAFVDQALVDECIAYQTEVFSLADALLGSIRTSNDVSLQFRENGDPLSFSNAAWLPKQIQILGNAAAKEGEMLVPLSHLLEVSYGADTTASDALLATVVQKVNARLDEILQETGYAEKYPDGSIPDSLTDPEMCQIYWDYVEHRNWVAEEIPEQWLERGYEGSDPIFDDVFLPIWTEGEENSYLSQYEKICPPYKRKIEIDGKTRTYHDWAWDLYRGYFSEKTATGDLVFTEKMSQAWKEKIAEALLQELQTCSFSGQIAYRNQGGNAFLTSVGEKRTYRVAGIIFTDELSIFINESTFDSMYEDSVSLIANPNIRYNKRWSETEYVEEEVGIYDKVYLPYDHSKAQTEGLKAFGFDFVNGSRLLPSNPVVRHVEEASERVELLSTVFLWAGLAMALFSALLLSNFISVSIANKKKEIGILRALGARGVDVFKIFFAESITIALACVGLGVVASVIACGVLNAELGAALSGVSLFVFGPLSIVIMLAVALLTTVIATFLPVYLAARKKPVDSIRSL